MNHLLIAVAGFLFILALTGLGCGLGRVIDPLVDRLESSIEWKECE